MQGALHGWDAELTVDRLDPFVQPDLCLAHLAPLAQHTISDGPDDDEAFLRQVRERAESQMREAKRQRAERERLEQEAVERERAARAARERAERGGEAAEPAAEDLDPEDGPRPTG